jgi:hypothetical protein
MHLCVSQWERVDHPTLGRHGGTVEMHFIQYAFTMSYYNVQTYLR